MHLIFICAAVFGFSNADASRLPSSKMLICCLVGSTQKEKMVGYSSLAEIRPYDSHNYRVTKLAVIRLKFWFWENESNIFVWGEYFQGIANTWDHVISQMLAHSSPKRCKHVEAAVWGVSKDGKKYEACYLSQNVLWKLDPCKDHSLSKAFHSF